MTANISMILTSTVNDFLRKVKDKILKLGIRQNDKSFSTKTIWPWIKDEFLRFGQEQNFNENVLNEFKRLKYDNDALSREEEIRKIFDRQVKERIQFSDDISSHIPSSITRVPDGNSEKVIIDGDVGIHESVFNQEQISYLETRCIARNGFSRERNRVKIHLSHAT